MWMVYGWQLSSFQDQSRRLVLCSRFDLISAKCNGSAMDAASERKIIRLWNRLRLLEKEGRPITAVLRQIESALAERERHAA
jgi:hypothetical protein